MASNIDPSQPPALNPTTAGMRANMQAAKTEIETLQSMLSSTANGYLQMSPGYFRASPTEVLIFPASHQPDGTTRTIEVANTSKLSGEYPPSDAKILLLNLTIVINARGTEGPHNLNIFVFSDDLGAENGYTVEITAWEPAGLTAGTMFAREQRMLEFPVIGPSLEIAYFFLDLDDPASTAEITGWRMVGFRR